MKKLNAEEKFLTKCKELDRIKAIYMEIINTYKLSVEKIKTTKDNFDKVEK